MTGSSRSLVCFDFWLTLVDGGVGRGRHDHRVAAFSRALRQGDTPVPEVKISELMRSEWQRFDAVHNEQLRTLTNAERVSWMAEQLGVPSPRGDSLEALLTALEDSLFVSPPRLLPHMDELVRSLAEQHTLAIISDTSFSGGKTLRRLLDAIGLLGCFDVLTFSDEIGRAKPHPRPFEQTLAEAGAQPARSIHIGDREHTDVIGAKQAGLTAVLFTAALPAERAEQLVSKTVADFVAGSVDELRAHLDQFLEGNRE